MNCQLTIQERLKDLRVEKGLNLEELSKATGISRSALGSYENDDYKEINHGNLLILAKFYGVSTDYLLCLVENRCPENTDITELRLNDAALELLKSRKINNRLLCEIITHEEFKNLMIDTEIFIDGHATQRFRDINESLTTDRKLLKEQYHLNDDDYTLRTLEAGCIEEEPFFLNITHKTWDSILRDIRKSHEHDVCSTEDHSSIQKLTAIFQQAKDDSKNGVTTVISTILGQLGIRYSKLTPEEQLVLHRIISKSPVLKSPIKNRKRK